MTTQDIENLLSGLKKDIPSQADWENYDGFLEDPNPFLDVTIATTTGATWGVQTGDIIFSGEARKYQKRHTVRLFDDSNVALMAKEASAALA